MKKYYFIGIGGIGMSGLAKILFTEGNTVIGSDKVHGEETKALEELGIKVYFGQETANVDETIDVLVTTSAIKEDNPDLVRSKELDLKVITRPELLNEILSRGKGVAITGTHGKTTVSSMLSMAMIAAGVNPTVIVGAEIPGIGTNARKGSGVYSVAEVCEYQRAFLEIHPYGAVITNVDADHLDCYKDIDDIKAAFSQFARQIDTTGFLAYCYDDKNTREVASNYTGTLLSYGESQNAQYQIRHIEVSGVDSTFEIMNKDSLVGRFSLKVPGRHNILNAAGVVAVCDHLGLDMTKIADALASFTGADRRFQILGNTKEAIIIDDYGHHPTEIRATLAAARERYPMKKIIAVFQPHQHSRTKLLMNDFAESFGDANEVVLPEIYAVRDTAEDIANVSSSQIANIINEKHRDKAIYFHSFEEVVDFLKSKLNKETVVITIGAGPVNEVAKLLLK